MNLFKWTKNLKPKFPNAIEKFFGKKIDDQATEGEEIATVPSVNINAKNKGYEISVAVPGLDKKDINLEIQDNYLIISSEKQYENEDKKGQWMRREFGYASFQRMFQLPEDADTEKVDASMKNGVLKVKMDRLKDVSVQRKSINVA